MIVAKYAIFDFSRKIEQKNEVENKGKKQYDTKLENFQQKSWEKDLFEEKPIFSVVLHNQKDFIC